MGIDLGRGGIATARLRSVARHARVWTRAVTPRRRELKPDALAGLPIAEYARRLTDGEGRLYLSGLDPEVTARWVRGGYAERTDKVHLYEATPYVGESTLRAFHDAETHAVVPVEDPGD